MMKQSEAEWLVDVLERSYERWGKSAKFGTVDPMLVLARAALSALRRRGWRAPTNRASRKRKEVR